MIPTYNCASYLRETLSSVLSQDPGEGIMQIEVVDDCSTADDPEAVVQELGRGRVGFYRQPHNIGVPRNFETCLQRSRGHLVHLLHGDDCVRPGFYTKMQQAFERSEVIGAAFCRHIFMDEDGHLQDVSPLEQSQSGVLDNWLERLAVEQRIMTPAMVVRRRVYEKLGGFDRRLLCAEDWEMWVRIAAHFPVWYESEPLAAYRMHSNSNTGRHIRSAEDMRYTRVAIELFQSYLPKQIAARVTRKARETYALSALDMAYQTFLQRDLVAMGNQIREALQLSGSFLVMQKLLRILLKGGLYSLQRFNQEVLP
nr:glycosyltransferase [Nodosilinea sp. TSF1-S3]MDF0367330.1 glycosyltransferase [Nodosilinea sp. TSF1-S3]